MKSFEVYARAVQELRRIMAESNHELSRGYARTRIKALRIECRKAHKQDPLTRRAVK